MTLATIITTITTILTGVVGWFQSVFEFMVGNPLVLFSILAPIAIALLYKGGRFIKSFINKRRI